MDYRKRKRPKRPRQKSKNLPSIPVHFHQLNWLEWISIILGIWFFIFPRPYILLFSVLLVIPLLGILLNGFRRPSIASLVEVTEDTDGEPDYDVADFIDFPALVILVRVLLDFEFEDFYTLIVPGTIAFLGMVIVLLLTHQLIAKSRKNKFWIYGSLLFNICLYSYAGTYGANCVYDRSTPEVYEAEVTGKRISKGRKHTTYYIRVTPWGHHYDSEEISVHRDQYNEIMIGQTVKIDLHKGLFNIPWYNIKR